MALWILPAVVRKRQIEESDVLRFVDDVVQIPGHFTVIMQRQALTPFVVLDPSSPILLDNQATITSTYNITGIGQGNEFDNNLATYYSTDVIEFVPGDTVIATHDFGQVYNDVILEIKMYKANTDPNRILKVQVSTDGSTWTTIYSTTDSGTHLVRLPLDSFRYLRFVFTNNYTSNTFDLISVYEIVLIKI